jgi:ubiquinone/menaquinone biosynthesis C-methylase UbiE
MLPFLYDASLALGERRGMAARRRALLSDTTGRVLEIGAGTGRNLPHYPPAVELVMTEPDPTISRRLRRHGHEVIAAPAEALPFPDDSFDAVVSTLVLCTVGDPAAALAEMKRVLRPDGRLLFIEHVRASSERLARRQDRWARPWRRVAMGCRCNASTLALLESALRVTRLETAHWRGMPRIVQPLAIGEARP